jgi:hypothetical protein
LYVYILDTTAQQCRDRWTTALDPSLLRTPFTAAEDEKLIEAHLYLGNSWAAIAAHLPGRSVDAVKNRVRAIQKTGSGESKIGFPRQKLVYGKNANDIIDGTVIIFISLIIVFIFLLQLFTYLFIRNLLIYL